MIFKNDFIFLKIKNFPPCEKSARNNHVSSTREFWNLRSKTKSWNFFEVRWRPYSPKKSFLEDFIFIWNLSRRKVFCYNLFLIGSAFWKRGWTNIQPLPINTIYLLLHPNNSWIFAWLLPPAMAMSGLPPPRPSALELILWWHYLHAQLLSCWLQGHSPCHRWLRQEQGHQSSLLFPVIRKGTKAPASDTETWLAM